MIKSNHFEVLSFTMYETPLGPKTQLGAYIGNHHNFLFWPISKHITIPVFPNKQPVLAVIS